VYNADETETQLGGYCNSKIVCETLTKRPVRRSSNTKTSITSLHCICADGTIMPPAILFAGKYFPSAVTAQFSANYYVGVTENGSHIDLHALELCKDNGIILYQLHEHSAHLIQPCDMQYFRLFKKQWNRVCANFINNNPTLKINKSTFPEIFTEVFNSSSQKTVIASFLNSGIWPCNVNQINFDRCKPSKVLLFYLHTRFL